MKVKIKTWKQMEKEFGLDFYGDINCKYYFTSEMEKDMPKNRIIEIIDNERWWVNDGYWSVSEDMIKKIIGE